MEPAADADLDDAVPDEGRGVGSGLGAGPEAEADGDAGSQDEADVDSGTDTDTDTDSDVDTDEDADSNPEAALFDVPAQMATLREKLREARTDPKQGREQAAELPYARLALDVDLSHLDRPFDYLVPADLDAEARPGVRIRARFAGQLVDGYILERLPASDFDGRFEWVQKVVSPEPVLAPEVADLARTVADRYAGTMADVLRLAMPPRHANAEKKPRPEQEPQLELTPDPAPWDAYQGGRAFADALHRGENPRAVWQCLPGDDWTVALAAAMVAAAASGRGALAVVPDRRDLDRLDRALTRAFGAAGAEGPRHVVLAEDLGPAKRYQNWLAIRRGDVKVAVGTRSAAFAPVADLGLVAIWDDGDDLHAEPRAPYPHVREVLALRAHRQKAAALIGGYACTAEAAQLVESGWAHPLRADRATVDRAAPLIRTSGEEFEKQRDAAAAAARLPTLAWRTAREALNHGPVLVQVPRGGYASALACVRCRKHARCVHCHGPLALTSGHAIAHCGWCGRPAGGWRCDGTLNDRPCGGTAFRLSVVGVARTAEELGRAFPQVKIIASAQDSVVAEVGPQPALVVATPGAEPVAEGGYQAALLLDGWVLLGRRDLRAGEEALRRWMNAAALVKGRVPSARAVDEAAVGDPSTDDKPRLADPPPGGTVIVMAEPALAPTQALIRWDPVWHARRELEDRAALHYPPAARVAELTGSPQAVAEELRLLDLPPEAEVLGPVTVESRADRSDRANDADRANGADRPDRTSGQPAGRPSRAPKDPLGRAAAKAAVAAALEQTRSAAEAARPAPEVHRAIVRVPRPLGPDLAARVREAQGVRSARKAEDWVRVRIDPMQIG